IHGVDATQTLSDVAGALGNVVKGRLDAVPSPFQKGRSTPFSALEGRVDLTDGIGTVSKLALVSQLVRVSEGKPAQIDLPARNLDLMLQIQVAAHPPKVLATPLGSLVGATIPVRISGPWADPKYDVVWSEVHNQAIQQALKSGLMQLLSGKDLIQQALPAPEAEPRPKSEPQRDTVERLGNALKGLLGQ
ncbi:MAG TPA: hypothetical protein VHK04_11480, partial [Castellaniella sp.]|nr:hypothetical protein [Castellaniella sp.]